MSAPHPTLDRVEAARDAHHTHQPYIPADKSPAELTFRALALGSVLGIAFAASSVYLAVKVGLTVSASIPIAVLSIAIFRALGKASILENTIVQTAGSAGESLAFGVAAALPALLLLGFDISLTHAFLTTVLGGILGVLMMIPLRPGLIVQEHGKLMYPEGTAAADVLIVGEKGGTEARTVVTGLLVGGLYKFGYAALKLWREVVGVNLGSISKGAGGEVVRTGYPGASAAMEVSPELLGVGYIIGPRVAGITFAGGVLSYLILNPMISYFGGNLDAPLGLTATKPIWQMSPGELRNSYTLYIGAGAVAAGGLISLARSFPTIIGAFRRGLDTFLASRRTGGPVSTLRTDQDLPITVVIGGSLLMVLAVWLAPPLHVNFISSLLIVVFGFFFVTVSSRITGEIGSSSNPISGMVVATLLVVCLIYLMLGWTSTSDRFMALTTAAIVGIAASNGGTTAQDLKTAYLVGGTPKRQQIALFVGVITSAIFIGLTLTTINDAGTKVIPEKHEGVKLDEVTQEKRVQRELRWAMAPGALEQRGYTREQLASALWGVGYELEDAAGGATLLTFGDFTPEQAAATTVAVRAGEQLKLSDLGAITAGGQREYSVGYARSNDALVSGKYLVDGAGTIQYVVDPAIGGRVNEYLGNRLQRYEAPKASLFALIIDGVLTQKLPWSLVLLGVFIAIMLELCGVAALPFAVGVYLPISTSAPLFAGGLVRYFVDRRRGPASEAESEFSPGTLLSSGFIAGGALIGVVIAFLNFSPTIPALMDLPARFGGVLAQIGENNDQHPLWSNLWALALFGGLIVLMLRTGMKSQSDALKR